jgi:hypothetical protein
VGWEVRTTYLPGVLQHASRPGCFFDDPLLKSD